MSYGLVHMVKNYLVNSAVSQKLMLFFFLLLGRQGIFLCLCISIHSATYYPD